MTIVLGLAAALAYGMSDFVAGLLSRRVHFAQVALIGNVAASALIVLALAATDHPVPTPPALLWGVASGVGSAFGTLTLYRGLARGRMGVVAPLSALGAAALPVVIGVGLGDRPSAQAWLGVSLALPAIWLVSTSGHDGAELSGRSRLAASGVFDGLFAGVAFALLFIGLKLAGNSSGLWPVVAGQGMALVLLTTVLVGTQRTVEQHRLRSPDVAGAVAVGALGACGAICYFLSTQAGLLSIVAVLTSLYPAATVVLAAVLLREGVSRRQAAGLLLAGPSIILIALG